MGVLVGTGEGVIVGGKVGVGLGINVGEGETVGWKTSGVRLGVLIRPISAGSLPDWQAEMANKSNIKSQYRSILPGVLTWRFGHQSFVCTLPGIF